VNGRRSVPGLRVALFLDEEERFEGRPLWETVLEWARDAGLRTAIVTRGSAGFGRRGVMHTASIEVLMFPLPLTVECIGDVGRVESFLRRVERLPAAGVVEVQRTTLLLPEEA
jgi:PII-like signaling protein